MKKRLQTGFTLVELLIVLAIIGALMAIGIPIYTNALQNAKATTVATNLRMLVDQIRLDVTLSGTATHRQGSTGQVGDVTNVELLEVEKYVQMDATENYLAGVLDNGDSYTIVSAYKGTDVPLDKVENKLSGCEKKGTTGGSVYCEITVPKTSF